MNDSQGSPCGGLRLIRETLREFRERHVQLQVTAVVCSSGESEGSKPGQDIHPLKDPEGKE